LFAGSSGLRGRSTCSVTYVIYARNVIYEENVIYAQAGMNDGKEPTSSACR